VEEYSTIWLMHEITHTTTWAANAPSQLEIAPAEELSMTSFHFDLMEMIRASDTTRAAVDRTTLTPTSALLA
jgi:hypothetical protein